MKSFKTLIVVIGALFAFQATNAQSDKSERSIRINIQIIKVNGVCAMCKKRIEHAALSIDGVRSATWDEGKKYLTLKYDLFKKEAVDNVQKKIASVGHDNEKYQAEDKVYTALPDCCHYRNS